ncbi:MAG: 50S ribosomal protein L18 [Cyclobacteriaceae bacterium]
MSTTKVKRRNRIHLGIRRKIQGTADCPRLSVFRSNTAIYAQVIDDLSGKTISSAASTEITKSKSVGVDSAKEVGKKIAEKAIASGIEKVVFDRGGYLYHGKVKALAEGAREGGLKF